MAGGLPKVTVLYANGGLLADIAVGDGVAGLVGTGETVGLLGVPMVVYSLTDAEEKGITEVAEPIAYRHVKEFYAELGGNQTMFIMLVPNTMTMAQMLDDTNVGGAKKLVNYAEGAISLLGVFRGPGVGYDGGDDFIDSDVADALLTSKTFAQARLAEYKQLRILIEGRVQNATAANVLVPKSTSNGFAGVVLGGTQDDGSASIGVALGRAVKYGSHIKLGKVANGALSITTCYVGDKAIKEVLNLDDLHKDGFISFMKHPNKAGFYFGIDRMASIDDYRLLVYGRVIDKAARIAQQVYVEELESETLIDDDGKIDTLELSVLESKIDQQIKVNMAGQYSGLIVYINPVQDLINTGKLSVKLRVRPLGYKSFIDVDLGLTAPVAS